MYTVYVCCDILRIYHCLSYCTAVVETMVLPSPGGKHLDMEVVNFGKHHGNSILVLHLIQKRKSSKRPQNLDCQMKTRESEKNNEIVWRIPTNFEWLDETLNVHI